MAARAVCTRSPTLLRCIPKLQFIMLVFFLVRLLRRATRGDNGSTRGLLHSPQGRHKLPIPQLPESDMIS